MKPADERRLVSIVGYLLAAERERCEQIPDETDFQELAEIADMDEFLKQLHPEDNYLIESTLRRREIVRALLDTKNRATLRQFADSVNVPRGRCKDDTISHLLVWANSVTTNVFMHEDGRIEFHGVIHHD